MKISFWLNGEYRQERVADDSLLVDFLREKGCYSVKRGCETANCGLCTVLMDGRPFFPASMLTARIDGKKIVTIKGVEKPRSSGRFLPARAQSSAAFATPVLL